MASTLSPQIRILPGGHQRLLTDVGTVDPGSLASYREHDGYRGLERAVKRLSPEQVIAEIESAGLRGRGGAGFPTAAKWRAARAATADGQVTLETSSDVGSGTISPALRVDTLVYGPLTDEQAIHVVRERRAATTRTAAVGAGAS